jgi:hypothetical protein
MLNVRAAPVRRGGGGGGESANDAGRVDVFILNVEGNGLLLLDPNPRG